MKKFSLLILLTFALSVACFAQAPKAKVAVYPVGFYNLENLYYPASTDELRDKEFSPEGRYAWTMEKYNKKLANMAYTISQVAKEYGGLIALGVSEIGNRKVLEDLLATGELKNKNYAIVHYDSPDRRGVDVGLLYNPNIFKVTSSKAYPYRHATDPGFRTRDQLLVSGTLAGEPFHLIVNHWPSRYGGGASSILREYAAELSRHISDSIRQADPKAKIVIMGDLNDDPTNKSLKNVLQAKRTAEETKEGDLFNTMWPLFDRGIGSLAYQGSWNLFDQIIISGNLLTKDRTKLSFYQAKIFNEDFLIDKQGQYKGYPMRTFRGNTFVNGYSDHFPTYILLVKEVK